MTPTSKRSSRTLTRALTLLAAASLAVLLIGCTSNQTDDAIPETNNGESSISESEPTGELASVADTEGISEEAAEEPPMPEEPPTDTEQEEAEANAPQVEVQVSESAFCATLQIGRDAIVDGDTDLAQRQQDLLAERTPGLSDNTLKDLLIGLNDDQPLTESIAEQGLTRCEALGFEL